ncbi:MAG: hypothetical protein FGM15_07035 [Chthoniobacterales bacterium]|nr:hypothetical protein [Chthoniobacterales bacterium]
MVMPAAYICLPVGVAIVFAAILSYAVYDAFPLEIFCVGGAVMLTPGVLFVFRFLRGHFSDSLNEP